MEMKNEGNGERNELKKINEKGKKFWTLGIKKERNEGINGGIKKHFRFFIPPFFFKKWKRKKGKRKEMKKERSEEAKKWKR